VSFRNKLLAVFSITIALVVALVAGIVSYSARRSFERTDQARTTALESQFRRDFDRRRHDAAEQVSAAASSDALLRMTASLSTGADANIYVNEASSVASARQMDLLELVSADGTILSSSQWPGHFGYKDPWVIQHAPQLGTPVIEGQLRREETSSGVMLAIVAVVPVEAGGYTLYVAGGQRLDREFMDSITLPDGMRAMLYQSLQPAFTPQNLVGTTGLVANSELLQPLIASVSEQKREVSSNVFWPDGSSETFHGFPLLGPGGEVLGVMLLGSSRAEIVALEQHIRSVAFFVGTGGILLAMLFSALLATRVTRPVEQLAEAAARIQEGDWSARVEVEGNDELARLAESFNEMTRQMLDQRERLLQSERVAAWRELARRLAHELKNPLFPMQITLENLIRAREQGGALFDETFEESTATLFAALGNLKTIIGRFSDFSKMPAPDFHRVSVNEIIHEVAGLFSAQLASRTGGAIQLELQLDQQAGPILADTEQLRRALQNLVLNAMDAMPKGGTLTIRTILENEVLRITISDTGTGLTHEECGRLFTPYYTTKQHGTGLGLAIVQSVVSDHHGKISVESRVNQGTTFVIELPVDQPTQLAARGANVQ
jgi:two-component system nitrogen regulation sensor histidine kinase NtrY